MTTTATRIAIGTTAAIAFSFVGTAVVLLAGGHIDGAPSPISDRGNSQQRVLPGIAAVPGDVAVDPANAADGEVAAPGPDVVPPIVFAPPVFVPPVAAPPVAGPPVAAPPVVVPPIAQPPVVEPPVVVPPVDEPPVVVDPVPPKKRPFPFPGKIDHEVLSPETDPFPAGGGPKTRPPGVPQAPGGVGGSVGGTTVGE
ncbi:hypothetical protein [Rhodococcus tibetensis]|uniref:Uncharacterized protein n=1 Tax=Rhodococcus tibetensis TaxID=2965064 RepID=A0ABT1Q715_9NOCA|nr:hypothetical protein [Rhodococcus sp. FXJ9.536]MCQ4118046.1 hypothetical protein [Rhodococcus sp. FXJ9.536]